MGLSYIATNSKGERWLITPEKIGYPITALQEYLSTSNAVDYYNKTQADLAIGIKAPSNAIEIANNLIIVDKANDKKNTTIKTNNDLIEATNAKNKVLNETNPKKK